MIITRKATGAKGKTDGGIRVRPAGRRKRFIGICAEASRLGVSVEHLWMVLTGRRVSQRIMREVRIRQESETGGGR